MKRETEERFRERLLKDIERHCSVSGNLYIEKDRIDLIFDFYRRYRDVIHDCIEQGSEGRKEYVRMDRHKIAAAFFCSIIKVKPIESKTAPEKFFERTVNVQLALLFSVLFVIDKFNISETSNTETDKKIFSRSFKLPKCKHSESKNYVTNFIMMIDDIQIEHLNIESGDFQPNLLFVISHLFFVLDAYSYQENRCLTMEMDEK
ncbi:MAG: hypothetical protein FWB77_00320 [Treponema sp.]|nr:hypothetical protein [Treponema sp.]